MGDVCSRHATFGMLLPERRSGQLEAFSRNVSRDEKAPILKLMCRSVILAMDESALTPVTSGGRLRQPLPV